MSGKKVLVVGDVIRDHYVYVDSSRKAPEAPIPVWDFLREESRLGGAANVAANISSLGKNDHTEVYLAGIGAVNQLERLHAHLINTDLCVQGREIVKTRFVSDQRIVFRIDDFKKFKEEESRFMTSLLSTYFTNFSFDAIVLSDYDKGTITTDVVKVIERRWPSALKIVDSKRRDLRIFGGYDVIKLNDDEYGAQASNKDYACVESLFKYCVVTKGREGSELKIYDRFQSEGQKYVVHTEKFKTTSLKAVDVTGCGDTHTAAMTVSLMKGEDLRASIRFANKCAGEVVTRFGTSVADCTC